MRKTYFLKTRLFYNMCKYAMIQGVYQSAYGEDCSQAKRMGRLADQFRNAWIEEFDDKT